MTVESYLKRDTSPATVLPGATTCLVIVLAAATFFAPDRSALANTYNELSSANKTFVDEQCLPIQYQEGAAAFRQCVSEQTALLFAVETPLQDPQPSDTQFTVETPLQESRTSDTQAAIKTPLQEARAFNTQLAVGTPLQALLTFDEQYALQQLCKESGDPGSDSYTRCATEQVDSLQGVPTTDLSQVSEDENYALQQSCYAIQSTAGVRAYRECLNTALLQLASVPSPDLSSLSLLDKNALQLRCSADNDEAASYRLCLLEAMGGATAPAAPLSDQTSNGFVSDSPETAPETPAAASPTDAPLTNEPLPLNTAIPTADIAEPILLDTTPIDTAEVEIQPAAQDTVLADSGESAVQPESNELADAAATQDDPTDTLDTKNSAESIVAQATNNDTSSITPADDGAPSSDTSTSDNEEGSFNVGSIMEKAKATGTSMWTQLQSSLSGLSGTNRTVMLAALALPIGLVGFWLLMRRRASEPEPVRAPAYENPLIDRVRPSQQQNMRDTDISAVANPQDFDEQFDELFAGDTPAESWQTAPTRIVEPRHAPTAEMLELNEPESKVSSLSEPEFDFDSDSSSSSDFISKPKSESESESESESASASASASEFTSEFEFEPEPEPEPEPEFTSEFGFEPMPEPSSDRGHLITWLDQQEPEAQLSLAIEFMIYWMAYGDERYEPEQKQKIFALTDPNEHELIKRWVLKQDVQAFAEVTQWLQSNASYEQHEQILRILMALLICENALTPSQNTLLRFLGDVFGAGNEQLDVMYQTAYGQAMPALPRVDKPLWWDQQPGNDLKRWDARSLAKQSDETQHRVKLGLPLTGDMDKQQIQVHFHRAAERCNPQTFNALPEREQMLVDKQRAKFEHARDTLLEVFA